MALLLIRYLRNDGNHRDRKGMVLHKLFDDVTVTNFQQLQRPTVCQHTYQYSYAFRSPEQRRQTQRQDMSACV